MSRAASARAGRPASWRPACLCREGRLTPLVLRSGWGDRSNPVSPDDPVLQTALRARSGFEWPRHYEGLGTGFRLSSPARRPIIVSSSFPSWRSRPIRAACSRPDRRLNSASGAWSPRAASARRPSGACSTSASCAGTSGRSVGRERRVVELSAVGKTARRDRRRASQISQRTVHAHLQNASEKLRAATRPTRWSRRCATGRSPSERDQTNWLRPGIAPTTSSTAGAPTCLAR